MEDERDRFGEKMRLWLDQGELKGILKKIPRGPLTSLIDRLLERAEAVLRRKEITLPRCGVREQEAILS